MLVKNHRLAQIRLWITQIIIFFWCSFAIAEEFIYNSHGKKDPFSPPVIGSTEKTGSELLRDIKLEGIIWDENKPMAIVNSKVVGIGDEISGAKIINIKKNEVIFDINGRVVSVRLRKEF